MRVTILADGASRGNPGPAAIGVVILDTQGETLTRISRTLGLATSNQAEYAALIAGLEAALDLKADQVEVQLDSELVARQMNGVYQVRSPSLQPLHRRAKLLSSRFASVAYRHVPREENAEADALANQALNRCNSTRSVPNGILVPDSSRPRIRDVSGGRYGQ